MELNYKSDSEEYLEEDNFEIKKEITTDGKFALLFINVYFNLVLNKYWIKSNVQRESSGYIEDRIGSARVEHRSPEQIQFFTGGKERAGRLHFLVAAPFQIESAIVIAVAEHKIRSKQFAIKCRILELIRGAKGIEKSRNRMRIAESIL